MQAFQEIILHRGGDAAEAVVEIGVCEECHPPCPPLRGVARRAGAGSAVGHQRPDVVLPYVLAVGHLLGFGLASSSSSSISSGSSSSGKSSALGIGIPLVSYHHDRPTGTAFLFRISPNSSVSFFDMFSSSSKAQEPPATGKPMRSR